MSSEGNYRLLNTGERIIEHTLHVEDGYGMKMGKKRKNAVLE